MYRISPFCPIFFAPTKDKYGVKSRYIQTFAPSDKILFEVVASITDVAPAFGYKNLITGNELSHNLKSWQVGEDRILYWGIISELEDGLYKVLFDGKESKPFYITKNEQILSDTVLIQYSMIDNLQRTDTVFWIDDVQHFFDFRAPGGFKDDNWSFGVENEQFITPEHDALEVFGFETTTNSFTLGHNLGCPVWFAELLNRILCCHYVYFDGVRYTRHESSTPEMNIEVEGVRSYIFTQALQRVRFLDPTIEETNQFRIRRIVDDIYRSVQLGENSKNLIINNYDE